MNEYAGNKNMMIFCRAAGSRVVLFFRTVNYFCSFDHWMRILHFVTNVYRQYL